jgi:protocatechuate 3,4-dioxygenase beta subunit
VDRQRRSLLITGCALPALPLLAAESTLREPVLGGRCEGCDWVFDGMPARPGSRARIAPTGERGDPLSLEGVVTRNGRAVAGIVVYAYHTNQAGLYPAAATRHGSLRGWALTDSTGRYRFDTIRPGAYPSRDIAEHVHMHVVEPGVGTYYIDNVEFLDDPLLHVSRPEALRAGSGRSLPRRHDGVWQVRRDIRLGENIPGYPR